MDKTNTNKINSKLFVFYIVCIIVICAALSISVYYWKQREYKFSGVAFTKYGSDMEYEKYGIDLSQLVREPIDVLLNSLDSLDYLFERGMHRRKVLGRERMETQDLAIEKDKISDWMLYYNEKIDTD